MHWIDYDFVVINDKVEKCYKQINNYINLNKNKSSKNRYNKKFIKNHIYNLLN